MPTRSTKSGGPTKAASEAWYTPVSDVGGIVKSSRDAYNQGASRSIAWRKQQLYALLKLLEENEPALCEAVVKDLRKPAQESKVFELILARNEIVDALENIDEWTRPHKVPVGLANKFDGCQIRQDPLGVVLIMSAWNYPMQLIFCPLVGAIAAGNASILKPSEISSNSAQLIAELIPKYLDTQYYQVINGGVEETTELLKHRFDKILYTGNGRVGRVILNAAAQYLTPVLLELGGKSPAIVDKDSDLTVVARRVAWGRFANCGQTCIAPDYVLCERSVQEPLVAEIRKAVTEYYGENPQLSPDYARIVTAAHFDRINKLITTSGAQVAMGGEAVEAEKYIAPTVLINVSPDAPVMQEEIFGPVLPIINVDSVDDAIGFVNARDKPLALYIFSKNKATCEKVLNTTSSGSAIANDVLLQGSVLTIPFGGVGASGTGSWHGKFTFDAMTHQKAVLVKDQSLELVNKLRYPPYSETKLKWLTKLLKRDPPKVNYVARAVFVVVLAVGAYYAAKRFGFL